MHGESERAGKSGHGPGKESSPGRSASELSASKIVEAAIEIADSQGLESVSIRRIARALDARPMSIYNHISNKDEILELMAEKAIDEVLAESPLPRDWREALSTIARMMYATYIAHPWLVTIFSQRPIIGPNAAKHAEQFVIAVDELPYKKEELWWFVGAMNDYVLGHSLRAVTAPPSVQLADPGPGEEEMPSAELESLPDYLRTRASIERFEFGMKLVLDGIWLRYVGGDEAGG